MLKIAFIISHYGKSTKGGDNDLCRILSEALSVEWKVDVLTTFSGASDDEQTGTPRGHRVYRFPKVYDPETSSECAGINCYLKNRQDEYDAIIVIGGNDSFVYLFERYYNVIYMPLAHDNLDITRGIYKHMAQNAAGFLFNTIEEKNLYIKHNNIGNTPYAITSFFLDDPHLANTIKEDSLNDVGRYIIYVGRVSTQKNFFELNDFFIRYKKYKPSELKLVVLGGINTGTSLIASDDIVYKGFVTENEKKKYIKNAIALVNPSLNESLSIVLLESWLQMTPVLVNGRCDVLRGQCLRSGGGLYYYDFDGFKNGLDYIINHREEADKMAKSGSEYVNNNYTFERVKTNINWVISKIKGKQIETDKQYDSCETGSNYDISPIISIVQKRKRDEESRLQIGMRDIMHYRFVRSLKQMEEVVIVGAGNCGIECYQTIEEAGLRIISAFADNNPDVERCIFGIPVMSLSESINRFPQAFYIVTPINARYELIEQLANMGIKKEHIDIYTSEYR